jgi:hypothetical protein
MIDLVGFGSNLKKNRFRVYIWGLSNFGQIPPNLSYFLGCFFKIKDTWSTSYFGLSSTGRSVETQTEHLKKSFFHPFFALKMKPFYVKILSKIHRNQGVKFLKSRQ